MIETYITKPLQKICIDAIANTLAKKLSPNFITILALTFGICVSILLIDNFNFTAIIFLLLSGYCDILDGSVARKQNKLTDFGAILDIVCDRIVEFAVILGLYLIAPYERSLIVICMLGSMLICITSFLVVGIFTQNNSHKSFYYSPGLMERAETFLFFIAMILLPKYFNLLGIIFIILVIWTAFYRIFEFKTKT